MYNNSIDKLIEKIQRIIELKEKRYADHYTIHDLIDAIRERQQISQLEDVLIYAKEFKKEEELNFEMVLDLVREIQRLTVMQHSTVCRDIYEKCNSFFEKLGVPSHV
jgi:hypothetical protein